MAQVAMISTTFLVVLLVVMESASMAFASLADVNINHEIPGADTIQVDCSKGSHHFVPQTLRYGQHFGWGFTPSVWGTTKYYCNFAWGTRTQRVRVWVDSELFPVKATIPRPCTHCLWRVTREGFYRVTSDYGKVPSVFVSEWL